jgi:hypothetical protein
MSDRSTVGVAALAAALLMTPAAAQVVDFGKSSDLKSSDLKSSDFKYPDLKGQWSRPTRGGNNWIALAGPPPLTPEYQKVWEDNQADVKAGGPGLWPSTFCIPAGMPAMMNLYEPMEIVVTPETTYILISHTDDSYRRIYTDGRKWPQDAALTYAGYSIGRWVDEDADGKYDVLEVETRFLKNPRGYDISGIPFHTDNRTVIKERIWLDRAHSNTLNDEITVFDHALTRPWTKLQKAIRNPDHQPTWVSNVCAENNMHVHIGNEQYLRSADGRLMPSKKGQAPPDLSYFRQ